MLTTAIFVARLAQANLASKTDLAILVKKMLKIKQNMYLFKMN